MADESLLFVQPDKLSQKKMSRISFQLRIIVLGSVKLNSVQVKKSVISRMSVVDKGARGYGKSEVCVTFFSTDYPIMKIKRIQGFPSAIWNIILFSTTVGILGGSSKSICRRVQECESTFVGSLSLK